MDRAVDILLVELDPVSALLILRAIEEVCPPCRALRVKEPEEAEADLEGDPPPEGATLRLNPALVILELMNPRKPTSVRFMRWVRRHPRTKQRPVVVLGVEGDIRSGIAAYDLGASSYLVKRQDQESFLETVRATVAYGTRINHPPE